MRIIKFRGQRLDNGEWVYGCVGYGFNQSIQYIMPKMYFATRDFGEVDENGEMIIEDEIAIGGFIPVNPETVGQFTGMQDKNGVDVYEGDVLSGCNGSINGFECKQVPTKIEFENGRFNVPLWAAKQEWDNTHYLIVIGNIHDNPELLTKN